MLIDSGSTDNFIHQQIINQVSLNVISGDSSASMASTAVSGYVITSLKFQYKMYDSMKLSVLDDLRVDIILGLHFQTQHDNVKFKVNGNNPLLKICKLLVLNVELPNLFCNLSHDCKPIATKSRKYNSSDKMFIKGKA